MKELILGKEVAEKIYRSSLREALKEFSFIGAYHEVTQKKYFVVDFPNGIFCFRPNGWNEVNSNCILYVFDTKDELLEWMKGE